MPEGIMEDDRLKGKDTAEPASTSFSTRSFDSSCLIVFRDDKQCCPECYEAAKDKNEPEKFDFYVTEHKNWQVTKDCIIKAKNVSHLTVSSETIRNIPSLLQSVKVILATHTQR